MLKKEFHEIFKQSIYFACIVVLLPSLVFITRTIPDQSYVDLLFYFFQAGLIFWPLFLGASLLSSERKQGGLEYLLTLPYSRFQLVWMKFLPRLCAVVFFPLLFCLLYLARGETYTTAFLVFGPIAYCALFLIAVSFSASSDNFVVISVASLVSIHIYLIVLFLIFRIPLFIKGFPLERFRTLLESHYWSIGLIPLFALFLVLPFIISFILAFKRFDIRPARIFNKRYVTYFIPLFALGLILSFLITYIKIDVEYKSYYLTQDHKLIHADPGSKIKIFEKDKVYETQNKYLYFWPRFDENGFVYQIGGWRIMRLDTSSHICETLYETSMDRRMIGHVVKYNQTFAFLKKEKGKSGLQLVLVNEDSKNIVKIPFKYPPQAKYSNAIIFGTDMTEGKRFWLIGSIIARESIVLKLWEEGKAEEIGKTQRMPYYINQMLITYTEQALLISKEEEGRFEIIKEIPEWQDYWCRIWPRENLRNIQLKEVYGQNKQKISRLDLETFETKDMGEYEGYVFYCYPDSWYFDEMDRSASTHKIYRVKNGKMEFLKSFQIDTSKKENSFRIFKAGIMLRKGKKIRVFAFPDLKEIKFKGL